MKYTIHDFRAEYPDDNACLDKLFQQRFGHLEDCPACGNEFQYRRIRTRRSYQCRHCYWQIYPTAGTIFAKTRTSLVSWFYVMYIMTTTRNGVSAKEVERLLGVTYKCAWRMCHQIRRLMAKDKYEGKLKGFVEMDETYVGGKPRTEDYASPGERKPGLWTKIDRKTIVFGMIERLGKVRAMIVPNTKSETLYPEIQKHVDTSANVSTDEFPVYRQLDRLGYTHGTVKHSAKEYRRDWACTNSIESFWMHLKRMISGTHIHVSRQHLQNYVDEAEFRYNNRNSDVPMFHTMLSRIGL